MVRSRVDVRELQRPIRERYEAEPRLALIELRARSGPSDLVDPLHCTVTSSAGTHLRSGAHAAVGGADDVACSGELLLAALVACQETTLRMVAANMGIDLVSVHVDAVADWDARGTLAFRDVPIGLTGVRCKTSVVVAGDERGERADRLLRSAEKYCVILNTLRGGVSVESTFELRTAEPS